MSNEPKGAGAKPVDFSELRRWLIGDTEPREVARNVLREAGFAARRGWTKSSKKF